MIPVQKVVRRATAIVLLHQGHKALQGCSNVSASRASVSELHHRLRMGWIGSAGEQVPFRTQTEKPMEHIRALVRHWRATRMSWDTLLVSDIGTSLPASGARDRHWSERRPFSRMMARWGLRLSSSQNAIEPQTRC